MSSYIYTLASDYLYALYSTAFLQEITMVPHSRQYIRQLQIPEPVHSRHGIFLIGTKTGRDTDDTEENTVRYRIIYFHFPRGISARRHKYARASARTRVRRGRSDPRYRLQVPRPGRVRIAHELLRDRSERAKFNKVISPAR